MLDSHEKCDTPYKYIFYKTKLYEKQILMILTIEQIKAARALLKWTQKDLAKHANLNDDQVHNFEAGRSRSLETIVAIHKAFVTNGLDFVSGGVIKNEFTSYTLNSYMDLLDDICDSFPSGGSFYKHCADESRSSKEIQEKIDAMRLSGITDYVTISEDNDYFTGKPKQYRKIPNRYFASSEVIVIYQSKVAFFIDGKVLVIVNGNLSRVFEDQFKYWWEEGKAIDEA